MKNFFKKNFSKKILKKKIFKKKFSKKIFKKIFKKKFQNLRGGVCKINSKKFQKNLRGGGGYKNKFSKKLGRGRKIFKKCDLTPYNQNFSFLASWEKIKKFVKNDHFSQKKPGFFDPP